MNDPLDQDLRSHYAALETPSAAELERRIVDAVRVHSSARSRAGRKLAVLAASLVIAAAVGWAVRTAPPKIEPSKSPRQDPPPPRPEEIAARVNGEVILWKEIEDRLKGIKPSDVTDELRNSLRRQLAEERLILQFAVRKNQAVGDAELEKAVQTNIRTYGSLEELERVVRIQYGTMSRYREDLRRQVQALKAYDYIMQAWKSDPELADLKMRTEGVPESELRAYYDANLQKFDAIEKVSFLRIGVTNNGDSDRPLAVLESVRRKLEKGGEFALLAYFYSDIRRAKDFRDRGVSRADLQGYYTDETIRYLFDDLKVGEVSPIVRDGKSLNLFKMEQKVRQKAESFEEAQGKIRAMKENQIREENKKKVRDWLCSHAKIEPADLFGGK